VLIVTGTPAQVAKDASEIEASKKKAAEPKLPAPEEPAAV
jgi:hypothetical protein